MILLVVTCHSFLSHCVVWECGSVSELFLHFYWIIIKLKVEIGILYHPLDHSQAMVFLGKKKKKSFNLECFYWEWGSRTCLCYSTIIWKLIGKRKLLSKNISISFHLPMNSLRVLKFPVCIPFAMFISVSDNCLIKRYCFPQDSME